MQARAANEGSAATHVPAYKAHAWLHRADHLQQHNNTLAHQLDLLSQRLLAAQQAQAHAELALQHTVQAQVCATQLVLPESHVFCCWLRGSAMQVVDVCGLLLRLC